MSTRPPKQSLSGGAHFFDGLDERLCGKRLGQVGDAARLDCRRAVRLAVVAGDIDDRQPYPFVYEAHGTIRCRILRSSRCRG